MKASARYKKLLVAAFAMMTAGVITMTAQIEMPSGFKPSQPSFPIAQQDHIKGGYHVVESLAQMDDVNDMDGLHPSKREVGMMVFSLLEKKSYILLYAGSSATVADDRWQEVTVIATYQAIVPYETGNLVMHENNLYICTNPFASLNAYAGEPLPEANWVNLGGANGGDFALKNLSNVERASVVDTLMARDAVADSAIQDGAVTETKILDGSVTRNKLHDEIAGAGLEFWPDSMAVAVDSTTITYDSPTGAGIVNIKVAPRGIGYNQLKSDNAADGRILSYNAGILEWTSPGDISVDPENMSLGLAKILVGDSTGVAHPSSVGGGMTTIYRNDSVLFFLTKDIIVDSLIDESSVTLNTLGAPVNPVSFGGQLITDVATPVNGSDAANKAYVDAAITDTFASRINDAYDSDAAWQLWSAKKLTDTLASYPVINASTGEINSAVVPTVKINKTYVVDSLEKILDLSIDATIDTVIYTGDIVIDETYNTSYMFVGYDDGSDDTLSYGGHVDTLSVSASLWKPIDFGQVISVNGQTGAVLIDWDHLPTVQAQVNAKESSLGDAAANQQILTSIGGTRSWVNAGDLTFALDSISDVDAADKTEGRLLIANGTQWESTIIGGDVEYVSGTGIVVSSNAVELGTQTIGNYVDYLDGDSAIKVYLKNGSTAEGAQYGVSVVTDESSLYVWKDSLRIKPGGVKSRHLNFRDGNYTGGSNMVLAYAAEDTFKWIQSDQLSVNPNNIPLGNGKIFVGNLSDLATEVDVTGDIAIAAGGATTIQADAVETGMIKDGDVGTDDLADKAVTTAKIADAAVEAIQISDDAVTGAKLNPDVAGAGLKKNIVSDSIYVNADESTISTNGDVLKVKDGGINTIQIADGGIYGDDINQLSATANQNLTWNGTTWLAATDSAIYTGFQDTIGLGATSVQRAIEALNTSVSGGNAAVLAKVQSDSTAIWDKVQTDSTAIMNNMVALANAGEAANTYILTKMSADSLYYLALMDADSAEIWNKVQSDSTAIMNNMVALANAGEAANTFILTKMSADSLYYLALMNTDSTEIWDKVQADSLALTVVLEAQRALMLAKIAVDSTYFEAQSDIDSTYFEAQLDADSAYFESQLAAGDAAMLAKLSADSTYFENQLDADSTALQDELDATQTGAGLNVDGTYAVNPGMNYIDVATDQQDADEILDTQLNALSTQFNDTMTWTTDSIRLLRQDIVDLANVGQQATIDIYTKIATDSVAIWNKVAADSLASRTFLNDTLVSLSDSLSTLRADMDALDPLPAQAGNAGQALITDGTTASWDSIRANNIGIGELEAYQLNITGTDKDGLAGNVLSSNADGTFYWQDAASLSVDPSSITLASGNIFVGNASSQAESQSPSVISLDEFGAAAADVSMGGHNITNVADPTLAQDAATKKYVDDSAAVFRAEIFDIQDSISAHSDSIADLRAAIDAAGGDNSAVQTELDATQAAAGTHGDGTYNNVTSSTYISGASSLNLADSILDVEVKTNADAILAEATARSNADVALQGELDAAETGAGLNANGTFTASSGVSYIGGATSIKNATELLDAQVQTNADAIANGTGAVQTELDATQAAAGIHGDGTYNNVASSTYISGATSLNLADSILDVEVNLNRDSIVAHNLRLIALSDSNEVYRDSINAYSDSIADLRAAIAATGGDASAVQSELDATQTGAGLGADGAYTANGGANYISTATTLKAADDLLDAQAKANADAILAEANARSNADFDMQAELDAAETGAGLNADGTFTASSGVNYIGGATSIKNATELLDAQVQTNADAIANGTGAVQTELDATQAAAGMHGDGTYNNVASSTYISGATSLNLADSILDVEVNLNRDSIVAHNLRLIALSDSNEVYRDSINAYSDSIADLRADINAAGGDASAVQSELDATQTGAGLGADGAYTANGGANYISTATTLKAADDLLDAQAKANADAVIAEATARSNADVDMQAELDAAETGAGLNADGTFTASSGVNYIGGATSIKNATELLDAQVQTNADAIANGTGAVQTELDATQAAAGMHGDGTYNNVASSTYISGATSLNLADSILDVEVKTNADAIVAEATARSTADGNLQTELDNSQSGAGLNADGTFTADATTNYATTATSLKSADKLLDTQIKANADAIVAAGSKSLGELTNVGGGADTETAGNILVADGDSWEGVAMSGDVTMDATGAVTIANDAVSTAKILDDAVTTGKIADGAVTSNKTVASFPGVYSVNSSLATVNQGVILSNPTLGNTVTLTLPAATSAAGVSYTIKNIGQGTVAVDGDGGELIDGQLTTDIDVQYGFVTIICDGTNWYKTAEYLPDYFAGVTLGVVQANKAVVVDGNRDIRNFRQVAVENVGGHENDAFYWGDPDTDGSWKATRTASGLKFEKRVSGSWQPMMEIE